MTSSASYITENFLILAYSTCHHKSEDKLTNDNDVSSSVKNKILHSNPSAMRKMTG
jgi:hypothetical protein